MIRSARKFDYFFIFIFFRSDGSVSSIMYKVSLNIISNQLNQLCLSLLLKGEKKWNALHSKLISKAIKYVWFNNVKVFSISIPWMLNLIKKFMDLDQKRVSFTIIEHNNYIYIFYTVFTWHNTFPLWTKLSEWKKNQRNSLKFIFFNCWSLTVFSTCLHSYLFNKINIAMYLNNSPSVT